MPSSNLSQHVKRFRTIKDDLICSPIALDASIHADALRGLCCASRQRCASRVQCGGTAPVSRSRLNVTNAYAAAFWTFECTAPSSATTTHCLTAPA
eukprot:4244136-Amphidinium_carterae.1